MAAWTLSGNRCSQSGAAKTSLDTSAEPLAVTLRLFQLNWIMIAAALAVFAASLLLTDFRIEVRGYLIVLGGALLYGVLGHLNRVSATRSNSRIYFSLFAMAQMTVVLSILTSLTYIAASANLPLRDANLLAFDRALGLDFRAYLNFMNDRPSLVGLLFFVYNSIQWQVLLVVVFLPLLGHARRTAEFILGFAIALIATTIISTLMPATGVYGALGLTETDFPNIVPGCYYYGLREIPPVRDGTKRLLDVFALGPVLTFPSFHTVTAILYAWALWPMRSLRAIGALWNGAMVVSTPVNGGHYFADILAGALVAVLSIRWVHHLGRSLHPKDHAKHRHVSMARDWPTASVEAN